MAEIITLKDTTVVKNYPNFHDNWQTNFNKLKDSLKF